tara:strand:+ start:321 stop:1865 length:1545 start_codon:yes stop_codon:yes gene_type:complete
MHSPISTIVSAFVIGGFASFGQPSDKVVRVKKTAIELEVKLMASFKAFAVRKRDYLKLFAKGNELKLPAGVWVFFDKAIAGDFANAQKQLIGIRQIAGRSLDDENQIQIPIPQKHREAVQKAMQIILEVQGAMETVDMWHAKFLHFYTKEIVSSIPEGSIYFGGTDPGRFAITMGSKSHTQADPFYTVTQNALADVTYLQYLRALYGERITIPSKEDNQRVFAAFFAEAKAKGVQPQGTDAVMDINGRLSKVIFNKNPDHDFYLEESFPLDWMKPHMVPHGLIFKLERKPLKELPPDLIDQNRKDWQKYMALCVGDEVVKPETTVAELCKWVETIYIKGKRGEFKGDAFYLKGKKEVMEKPAFQKGPPFSEQKAFSKMRCDQARLFTWRESTTQDAKLKTEYAKEADYAYCQAFALGPINPQVVFEFSSFLTRAKRFEEAKMVLNTFAKTEVDSPFAKQFYINVFFRVLFQEEAHWVSQKEYAKAIVTVQKMVEIDGENKAQYFQRIERYKKLQ